MAGNYQGEGAILTAPPVIAPKNSYDAQNEATFREEVRRKLGGSYDRRSNLEVPFGKKLSFTSAQGQVITFGYNESGQFTIQQGTSTPFGMASISYVSTVETTLENSIASLEVEVEAANDAAVAAASSAAAAATSATAAGTSATASQTSATSAATQASNAATSASQSSTSATNAAGSAATATTQATNAANSATNAGNSATAASGSASTAATQATAAGNSATAASGSATSAATQASNAATSAGAASTSASNASTSASQASTSASNAAGSASSASTSATNAANSSTSAGNSATAASTSASQASTSATNAGNSASSASTSATNAANSATTAGGSASAAATSASSASTSATAAGNSATSATSTLVSAKSVAAATFPSTFERDGEFFADSATFNPTTDLTGTFSDIAIEGRALSRTGGQSVAQKGRLQLRAGRTYSCTARLRIQTDATNGYNPQPLIGLVAYTADGTYLGGADWTAGFVTKSVADGWMTLGRTTTTDYMLGVFPTAAFIRAYSEPCWNGTGTSNAVAQITQLNFADVTESTTAAGSATASASSASSASTQASNAATSASAANTSATTATTQASNASTSASQASTSAGNAATSASTATTQASNAAGSASTASTQASNASASATAASNSATLSATFASGSQGSINSSATFADNTVTSGVPTNWANWTNGSGTRVTGIAPQPYAFTLDGGAGAQAGISQYRPGALTKGFYVLEADVTLNSGALTGAGVWFDWLVATVGTGAGLVFATDPDVTGTAVGAGTTGRLYRWRKLVEVPGVPDNGNTTIYAMSHWDGHGSVASANSITWHRCAIRAASQAEIEARQAKLDLVTTNANVATNTSAIATETSARAALQTLVTSRVGSKPASLLTNPAFSDYPVASGSIPPGWSDWNNGTSCSRGTGRVGAYSHIQDGGAGLDAGIRQYRRMDPGKHNLDIAIERSAGNLTGAGVLVQYFDASNAYLSADNFSFASVADARGNTGVSVGYDYRTFRLVFTAPANTYYAYVYLINHWSTFGSVASYNQIYWHQLDVTPVDYGSATVDVLATTVATVDGKLSASYGLTVDVNGRIASMKLLSDGTTSDVKFTASTFSVYNGTTDEAPFVVEGGVVKAKKVQAATLSAISADLGTITAGQLNLTAGSYVVRHGAGFGASSDLVLWYGLSSTAIGSATKTNGVFALATDGKIYFGATDLAVLTTPMTATMTGDYSNTHSVNTTPTIDVTATVSAITNGTSPYTYQWALVGMISGTAPELSNVTTASCGIYRGATLGAAADYQGTVSCTITDANGKQLIKYFNFADFSTI